ncbi:MAG: hypothetical protein ABIG67_05690 [Pseudomonadota bacterium]
MPIDQKGIIFPKQSVFYLFICLIGVVAFILVAIYPSHRTLANLDKDIAWIKVDMEGKKILSPLFVQLLAKIRASEKTALPFPAPKPLPEGETAKLSFMFGEMARQCELRVESVTPDFASLASQSKNLRVDVLLNGGFFQFRKFLLLLAGQPFLQSIEEIRIREIPGGRQFSVKIRILVG